MKTQLISILSTTVPIMVVSGMILGCGAESQKIGQGENSSAVSTQSVANSPASTNTPVAPAQPIPKITTAPPKLSPGVDEIVQLAQAGVGDEVLQAYIENSPVTYQLEVDEILYLHDLGLSAETIVAMVRHSQPLQSQPAAATAGANAQSNATQIVSAPTESPAAQPEQSAVSATQDNAQGPTNAYAITPPQQANNYFYETLAPYGTWVEVPDYGWCWQPTVGVVDVSWRPYCNRGRWLWTDCGWYWQSDYSWGWAPFHYGRWCRSPRYGWVWAPDTTWGPAWVTWRYSDRYCGWAPLPPGAYYDAGVGFRFGGSHVSVGFDFGLFSDCYSFIPTAYFCDRTPWYYCLPANQVVTVINQTTVINNYLGGPGHHGIINVGPGTNAIATVARHEIRKVALRDTNPSGTTLIKADRLERDGKTLAVFRPTLPQQAAAPPPQITRRQQELRKRSEFLAQSTVVKLAGAPAVRASGELVSPARGTPLTTPRPTSRAPDSSASSLENPRNIAAGQPHQALEQPTRTPVISKSPRSERRNPGASQPAQGNARIFQSEPLRPLAEVSHETFESRIPRREERPITHQPSQYPQTEFRSQPEFPADRQPARGQVITPPVYRQDGRRPESPGASNFSPPPVYNPPPTVVAPRAAEPSFNPPAYRPPQNFSPPPSAPRAIEPRPSNPAPSYSPPPAPSRPQPAPSPTPSQSRSDNGRK